MDWRIFLTTFGAVFLAELGDKTQLATMALASDATSKWMVFFGSALALVLTSALGVLFGAAISRMISPALIHKGAGLLFVAIGVWMLWPRQEGG